jgi:hypothetical protein
MRMEKLLLIFFLCLTATGAWPMSESQKINALLDAIEGSGLIFIRNGVEHSAKDARMHLERKLSRAGSRVRTAEQFIQNIASRSYMTGTPYYVKYPDGSTIEVSVWLRRKLREIERGGP